ncbi:MAG TPA: CRTAC1 family protein, partial [Acidobacteriota bacterium]|nr:CRTAC1 family protein [Acidobacteriota bacterium]
RLVDVTGQSGITFEHVSAPEKKYIVESMSGGVVVFDFDGDGLQDLYFVNSLTVDNVDPTSAPSHLYRNLGGLKFEKVPASAGVDHPGWGMGGCAGDYDGDGRMDLYVTALGGNKLYRNQGDGTFREVTRQARVDDQRWSSGCAFGDYDGDGDLDLFVANYVDFSLDSLPEFGKGALCQYQGIPVQCGPRGLPGAGDSLFRNEGDGTFSEVSKQAGLDDADGYYGLGVAWTDFDQDGKLDLFVANDGRPNYLYRNRGDGTFEDYGFLSGSAVGEDGSEQACMGVAIGDFNGDQRFDLFATNFSNEYNVLYRNDGDWLVTDYSYASRTAEASFPLVGWGAFFFDLDNDGDLDLFAVNGHVYPQVESAGIGLDYAQPKLLYLNQGDGRFQDVSREMPVLTAKRASRGAAYGDLDNDGDLDIVVNDLDGPPMLLRNDGGNSGNWLRVELRGPHYNRYGLNARVRLKAGGKVQLREVRSGGSYLSQHDLRVHFGLGQNDSAEWLEVIWPDGKTTRLESPAINTATVVEYR